jgi:hypothetical protein
MDRPYLESGGGKGTLHRMVITPRALDRDQQVADNPRLHRLPQTADGGVEAGAVVFHDERRHKDIPIKIAQYPFGSGLGAIDGHDPKVLRADLLNPRVNHPSAELQVLPMSGGFTCAPAASHHSSRITFSPMDPSHCTSIELHHLATPPSPLTFTLAVNLWSARRGRVGRAFPMRGHKARPCRGGNRGGEACGRDRAGAC